ncbi:hypothetical protein KY309_03570 [Candidatus Woesearchaeota archaeon]|nr:hypothetical protein [Candidatus Woesearchaeota archaeon]MBW3016661.1 hypothetical protein [Candidatus Woesearchaeota archaeon]
MKEKHTMEEYLDAAETYAYDYAHQKIPIDKALHCLEEAEKIAKEKGIDISAKVNEIKKILKI